MPGTEPADGRKDVSLRSARAGRGSAIAVAFALGLLSVSSGAAAADDSCPNAAVRAQQDSASLPRCMAYELVSPPQKGSQHAGVNAISPDGNRVLVAGGGFPGTPSTGGFGNLYASSRHGAGWSTTPLNLPASEYDNLGFLRDQARDLSSVLIEGSTIEQVDAKTVGYYLRGWDGSLRPASPPIQAEAASSLQFAGYQAAAPDLSRYVFTTSNVSILPGYDPVGMAGSLNIYEVTDALTDSPQIRRVDVDDDGQVVGALCSTRRVGGAGRGANAMSADGSKIFFSAYSTVPSWTPCLNKGSLRVLARIDGTTTVEVSKSQCNRTADPVATPPVLACNAASDVRFEGAAADGSTVMLSTVQQLTNDDTNTASDLYMYRFASGDDPATLTRVSAAVGGAPDTVATVQGAVALSDDTSQLYFVARGRLTTVANARGEQPVANSNNLYLFERTPAHPAGRLVFVATLAAGDSSLWGTLRAAKFPVDNERVLVFPSSAKLTADDSDVTADVFRYDADTGVVQRVSHANGGYGSDGNDPVPAAMAGSAGTGAGTAGRLASGVDATGASIVFITREALDPGDENGLDDLYIWRDGQVDRVTDGRGTQPGVVTNNGSHGISEDGNSVVFSTANQLVAEDGDGANDVYVARVDGGALSVPAPDSSCVGDLCQDETAPPIGLQAPLTEGFHGSGNVLANSSRGRVRVARLKPVTGSSAKLRVTVPGKGKIRIVGGGVRGTARTVSKSGTFSVPVRLSRSAKRRLLRNGRVSVRVTIRFTPAAGRPSSVRVAGKFRSRVSPSPRRATVPSSDARKGR